MFKRNILVLKFFLTTIIVFGQVTAFKGGERLTFSVAYAATGANSTVAQIEMNADEVVSSGKRLFKLEGKAYTYSNYDRVFKIRDVFRSYVYYNDLRPIKHKRDTDEGGAKRIDDYVFRGGQATVKITKKGSVSNPNKATRSSTKNVAITDKVKDILGALYYLRASPLSRVPKGKSIKVPVIFDGEIKNLSLRFDGIKSINTVLGKKDCYKYYTSARGDSNSFSGSIYFTADANKVPVLIEASIPVGRGVITLTNASGLRN